MSSFVVSTDEIDYLVATLLRFVADDPEVAARTPDQLGALLLSDNIETVCGGRYLREEDPELYAQMLAEADPFELAEMAEERALYQPILDSYRFRPVDAVEPLQAAVVACCWKYQRGRNGPDDFPPLWVLVDRAAVAAFHELPPTAFADPEGPRNLETLVADVGPLWRWSRSPV